MIIVLDALLKKIPRLDTNGGGRSVEHILAPHIAGAETNLARVTLYSIHNHHNTDSMTQQPGPLLSHQ